MEKNKPHPALPWTDIVQEWDKIPLNTYKLIFEQAKDRYDELLSESRSLTEKSIGLTKLTISAIAAFVGFKFLKAPDTDGLGILLVLYILNLLCLVTLMFPKGVVFRGSPPKDLYLNYLENPEYNDNDKETIVYYHELLRYQQRMDIMRKKNSSRYSFYIAALILTTLSTILTASILISTLISWPPS